MSDDLPTHLLTRAFAIQHTAAPETIRLLREAAAELARLRAKVEAADKLAVVLDEVSLSDLEGSDFRKVFAALSAYEGVKE